MEQGTESCPPGSGANRNSNSQTLRVQFRETMKIDLFVKNRHCCQRLWIIIKHSLATLLLKMNIKVSHDQHEIIMGNFYIHFQRKRTKRIRKYKDL
jgi:hypothetical protein